ncbi:Gp37-like protein, partial [Klebsiella pneumoniae]|uniref:Gp37-like protein n=1 Tax=Klebsiella pneumoniae TaxID=573 RepID=UPI003EE1B265
EGYSFERTGPTATRVIVGGRNEGVDREFVEFRDTALETDWGDIIEVFKDARNTEEGADLTVDAREALAEGRPTSGISTTLNETDRFRYGT